MNRRTLLKDALYIAPAVVCTLPAPATYAGRGSARPSTGKRNLPVERAWGRPPKGEGRAHGIRKGAGE